MGISGGGRIFWILGGLRIVSRVRFLTWDPGKGVLTSVLAVDIGTPPQRVMVFIDTGSYELWVNPRCNTSASVEICENHGHYYPEKSNTSVFVANGFSVRYGTGEAVGHYFRDVIGIASRSSLGVAVVERAGGANVDG